MGVQGCAVVDVRDPAQPSIVGSIGVPGNAWGIDVRDRIGGIVDVYDRQIHMIDVDKPFAVRPIASIETPGLEPPRVGILGRFAYLTDLKAGITVVDIADPAVPVIVERVNTPGTAMDIQIRGISRSLPTVRRESRYSISAIPRRPSLWEA
jgi:hypothetical protein